MSRISCRLWSGESFGIHSRQQKDPRRRTSCSQNHSKHPSWPYTTLSKLNGQDSPHIKPNYKLFSVWMENAKGQLRSYNQTRFQQHIEVSCKAICLLVFNTHQFHGRSKNSEVRSEKLALIFCYLMQWHIKSLVFQRSCNCPLVYEYSLQIMSAVILQAVHLKIKVTDR